MTPRSAWLSAAFAAGLLTIFIGERLVGAGAGRIACSSLGVLVALGAFAVRVGRSSAEEDDRRAAVERTFAALQAVGTLAVLAYFLQSDLLPTLGGPDLSLSAPRLAVAFRVVCALLALFSLLPLALGELAFSSMGRAPAVEEQRVQDAVLSGVGLASVLVTALALGWVADARDAKADLSYFRTARPSEATRAMVRGLTEPVTLTLFFPPGNDVGAAVAEYARDLARENPRLEVHLLDQAIDLAQARELGVTANGSVVVSRAAHKEVYVPGLEMEQARGELRALDAEVSKRLAAVARAKQILYLTTGHGERVEQNADALDARGTVRVLRELLKAQNDELRPLGLTEGLATEVPKDAGAVLVLGPTAAFLPEEIQALNRYVRAGGRMLIALDPEVGESFDALLQPLGVRFVPTILANDRVFVPRAHQPSDRALLVTATYSFHPSVATLARLGVSAPMLFITVGSLEVLKQKPAGTAVDFTVMALPDTFRDLQGNFTFEPRVGKRRAWELAAAVTLQRKGSTDGRAVVVADSDVLTDVAMEGNVGNRTFALDSVRWLLGEDAIGAPSSEVDVPMQHTRGQDVLWFYATLFLAPALALTVGVLVTRRRRVRR
ncbi:MAG: Gldg family protein [Myxococcaceae bacterium]